jgi:nucleotide-binding universal stress UspA family protein
VRILLAIDDSEWSRAAVRSVAEQFREQAAEIQVLHVVEPIAAYISAELIPHFIPHVATIEEDRRKQARELVRRTAQELRDAGFSTIELVEEGNPKEKIIDQAEKWNADLIVVGSHGWKGLNRFLLGSVSDSVVRHAGCSVEIVKIPAREKQSANQV